MTSAPFRYAAAIAMGIAAIGKRMAMDEVALYTVANGKIVREEFFYAM